jgi:PIN domain nuclease of toxin-antitoxin system
VRLLLDTHVLLWLLAGSRKLPREARELVVQSDAYVSAASIWEIAIKVSLGKLDVDPEVVRAALGPSGFEELPVTAEHAAAVSRLPLHHHDPFDRLLVSQASVEPMVLLTADAALCPYGPLVKLIG